MIELIPAIDIIDGSCVRLRKGDYQEKTVYSDKPADMAKHFEALGFKRLHVVDLDGAKSKHIVNIGVLESIRKATKLKIDFGGGLKTDEDIEKAFLSGADMVTVGSVAVSNPALMAEWIRKYGSEKIILGADVRQGMISINGWKEDSQKELIPFLEEFLALGVKNVLCTEISKDGMLSGPALGMYKDVMRRFPEIRLIASGGVSSMQDIQDLEASGIPSVVFGKAMYEGRLSEEELKKKLNTQSTESL